MRCSGAVCFLFIFCLNEFVQNTGACTCIRSNNNAKYCQAEFGLKAQVVRETSPSSNGNRVYMITTGVRQFRTLKGNFANVDLKRVYTASSSAACGVTLKPGKVYLLSGSINKLKSGHRLEIHLCGWIQEWNTLSQDDKNFVRNGYINGCDTKGSNTKYIQ
ncbi:hypothetical protein ACJMK2_020602 [Sinanodonta woodiana]|uniref:NTR domain-containing protein n=1 Tax=Sinanodonta woodiana TaxID=1069815 RepID=A0ABD3TZJ9_SINWO